MPINAKASSIQPQAVSDEALAELEKVIQKKYLSYIKSYRQVIWPTVISKCPDRGAFVNNGISQVNFDLVNFNLAVKEILQDIKFISARRGSLISVNSKGQPLMSAGKLAGVITYRLSRRQIAHSDYRCLQCKIRCVSKLNTQFALQCGTEFIAMQFTTIEPLLQKELFYQLTSRHVNQETLGLIFDTIHICSQNKDKL
ncbi:MAG: hypothetical protein FWC01_04075 [Treponema sp.]|nr:hypothetical protein [Treponema sp.]